MICKAKRYKKPVSLLALIKEGQATLTSRAAGGPIIIGDVTVRETSESGAVDVADILTRGVVLEGLYADLENLLAAPGTEYTEYSGFSVSSCKLIRKKGGLGKLTIALVPAGALSGFVSGTPSTTTWEIDMAQLEKPLACHPALMDDSENPDLVANATQLDMWKNETRRDLRDAFKYLPTPTSSDTDAVTLTGMVLTFAKKVLRGQESYIVFGPVVTKTSLYEDGRPATGKCGIRVTPEIFVAGYKYLKTGDHVVQNSAKSWTRTEKWTGVDEWDVDLYPTS